MEILDQKKTVTNQDKCPTKKTFWYCKELKEFASQKRRHTSNTQTGKHKNYNHARKEV